MSKGDSLTGLDRSVRLVDGAILVKNPPRGGLQYNEVVCLCDEQTNNKSAEVAFYNKDRDGANQDRRVAARLRVGKRGESCKTRVHLAVHGTERGRRVRGESEPSDEERGEMAKGRGYNSTRLIHASETKLKLILTVD